LPKFFFVIIVIHMHISLIFYKIV